MTTYENPDKILGETNNSKHIVHNESVIKELSKQTAAIYFLTETPAKENQTFTLDELFFNGKLFSVKDLELVNGQPKITTERTDYLSLLSVSSQLVFETYNAVYDKTFETAYRDSIAQDISKLTNPSHLPRPISVSATVFYPTDDGWKTFTIKRSSKLLSSPNCFSTIPAGGLDIEFEPDTSYSIEHLILKEFVEELFNKEYNGREFLHLKNAQEKDQLDITTAGTHYTALTGELNVSTTLVIVDEDLSNWVQENLNTNWESDNVYQL